jgi:hypothetical protein
MARRLAALKRYDFAGAYDAATAYDGPLYFVPSHTLVGIDAACKLGIRTVDDLFGGVVPYSFVATKAITHPRVGPHAFVPTGWSDRMPSRVTDSVLFGFSAFTVEDARTAAALVLERGVARVKPACAVGGRGQSVITALGELDDALHAIDPQELSRDGVVVERNFDEITTYSVGQVQVADLLASYCGTQRVARDNGGVDVYGGSDLVVVRGDYDAILALDHSADIRAVVGHARIYDAAAREEFRLIASRRNYDVACVTDSDGTRRAGVLEQSWRIGGASPAEIMALEAFRADPQLAAVRACCTEIYGDDQVAPPNAVVHFRGVDDRVGPLIKYTTVEAYGNSR